MSTDRDAEPAPDIGRVYEELREVREHLEGFEADVESRTVKRAMVEAELKRYVRWRQRKGHARGWGPYLVLLYGTAMNLGAFYYLDGAWAILAMVVLWLSTLGLYALMVIVSVGAYLVSVPGRARERLGSRGGADEREREAEAEP